MTRSAPRPDGLDGATVFMETAERPIAGGRWYVRADDSVAYQHPDGTWSDPAIVGADTLRRSPTWTAAPAVG